MMKVFIPSIGKKIEVNPSKVNKHFFWCNCENPSVAELKKVANQAKIGFEDISKYKNINLDSKLFFRKNYDVLLLKYPTYKSNKIILKNIEIIFSKKFIITIYEEKIDAINNFAKNIKEELIGIKKVDYFYFLHRMLTTLSKEFFLVLDNIELNLEKVEESILKPKINIKNLVFIRKNLLFIRKALVGNRNVILDLQEGASKYLIPNQLLDVYTDVGQILDIEELFRDRLTSILDLHLSSMSNKMNDVMKSFTVIASLLLVPMLISGIYGMNVKLPLQNNPNAFYSIILLILLSLAAMLLIFKAKEWI